jgi:hypothetical protein
MAKDLIALTGNQSLTLPPPLASDRWATNPNSAGHRLGNLSVSKSYDALALH